MKLDEFVHYNLKSKSILNESWDMLTESQRIYIGSWEKNVWPLMEHLNTLIEAELTPDQIEQLFTSIETSATQAGDNKTAIGKAASGVAKAGQVTADAAKKVNSEIKKLLNQAQNSEPVKNMDAQFDKLRTQISNSVKSMPGGDKILAGVDKWKKFGEENPMKQAFIIGAMTSLLAFASGGALSGAAIGFFVRAANNTIKGDQLSTAIGKGAKGAAIGAVAGAAGSAFSGASDVADAAADSGVEASVDAPDAEAPVDSGAAASTDASADSDAVPADSPEAATSDKIKFASSGDVEYDKQKLIQVAKDTMAKYGAENTGKITEDIILEVIRQAKEEGLQVPDMNNFQQEARLWIDSGIQKGVGPFAELQDFAEEYPEPDYEALEAEDAQAAEATKEKYDAMSPEEQKAYDQEKRNLANRAGDSYEPPGTPKYDTGADTSTQTNESIQTQLSETQVLLVFEGVMDKVKGAVSNVAGKTKSAASSAIGKGVEKAKQVGKNITTKVTANKLMQAWEKAGKPTDSDQIAAILSQNGVGEDILSSVYTEMDIPFNPESLQQPEQQAQQDQQPSQQQTQPAQAQDGQAQAQPAQGQAGQAQAGQAQAGQAQAGQAQAQPAQAQAGQAQQGTSQVLSKIRMQLKQLYKVDPQRYNQLAQEIIAEK